MNEEYALLCRRYATAFLNIYNDELTLKDCEKIKKAENFLRHHRVILTFFDLPDLKLDRHACMIDLLIERLNLPKVVKPLLLLLDKKRHIWLLPEGLAILETLFFERRNMLAFNIESYPVLSEKQLEDIKGFLRKKTGKEIVSYVKENEKLIAGVRAQSRILLWEYSIAKKLREAGHVVYE